MDRGGRKFNEDNKEIPGNRRSMRGYIYSDLLLAGFKGKMFVSCMFSTADLDFCVRLSAVCSQQQILISVSVCQLCVLNSRS